MASKLVKTKLNFAVIVTLFFISCGQAKEKTATISNHQDSSTNKKEQAIIPAEEQEKLDSINDEKVLAEAIKTAEQYSGQNRFNENYISSITDSFYQSDVYISSDFYFSKTSPHLIIKRQTPMYLYIDIFSRSEKLFQKILSHKQWALEYTGDTIRDINGDGLKDFVVNRYGSTGCCLKAFSDVYLLRPAKNSFSTGFTFINPTFSPKEKIIRGVCYGHPGETEMYKYKWNKEAVDTMEYVYYEKNDKGEKTGNIIVSNNRFPDDHGIQKRLTHMPAEYKKIEGYDWFTANFGEDSKR